MPNKYWLEIERLSNKSEAQTNAQLKALYRESLKDLNTRIGTFMAEHQDMRYVDMLQLNRMKSIYAQIDDSLAKLTGGVRDIAYKADLQELEYGYFGEWYNIEKQLGSNISYGLMSENRIRQLIEFPVNGIPLSKRLYGEVLLANQKSIKGVLAEGLIQGYDNKKMARRLSETMDVSYGKAKTIVRTESGRINSMARQDAVEHASELGVDTKKEWVSTLDRKTRHTHQELDGQIVGVSEDFTSPAGYRAPQPRMFGVPSEDINCRCGCTSVVYGFRADKRRDNESKKVIDNVSYSDWLKKYHNDEYAKHQEIIAAIKKKL